MTAPLLLRAPAKLNLTLEVLSRRGDGLHALRSVMVPIDLYDEIEIDRTRPAFAFSCDDPSLASGNLVERAFAALDLAQSGYGVHLRKRIPTGAGMGGGSSDAAAILLAAQNGAFGAVGERDYLSIARSLGSDVPFFLVQTGALVEGTGERITAAGALPPWHAVVVAPPVAVSTAAAYAALDASERPTRTRNTSSSLAVLAALQSAQFERAVELLHNDFETAIAGRSPEITSALDALRRAGASRALLTGSGSCVFALTRTAEDAAAVAARIDLPKTYGVHRAAFAAGSAWRTAA
ncbi:MAG TPA: 4-(cytidine 5'-diphospho)-2-C-methyl-D-erythritol kinase [Candidatus Baltobacteraceae bacterium]